MNPPKTRKLFALVARFIVVHCAPSCAWGSREIVSYFSSSASFDGCFKDFTIENLHPAIGNPLKELVAFKRFTRKVSACSKVTTIQSRFYYSW